MSTSFSDRGRILIADDDQKVLDLLVELLEQEGYEVSSAKDGAEALTQALSFSADVIISDVVMPVVDGLELCRRLKDDPRTANIPVLLISGIRKSSHNGVQGLSAGADDYLDIPFRHEELLIKVARLAERHRVEKQYREIVEQSHAEQKLAEDALKESEEHYRRLVELSPIGVATDVTDGRKVETALRENEERYREL